MNFLENETLSMVMMPGVLLLMVVVFYFLSWRPHKRRQREREQMLCDIKKGDKVVTIGGLHATVVAVSEGEITLRTLDNLKLVFERSAIHTVSKPGDEKAKSDPVDAVTLKGSAGKGGVGGT